MAKLIGPEARFVGERVTLRLALGEDCNGRYLGWLMDSDVNRFLETRWSPQDASTIRAFVDAMLESDAQYLFAITIGDGARHIGNIKIGPIDKNHLFADVSYFIGERGEWGRGFATDAIRVATRIGFEKLGLHRVQAGLYESNVASAKALERAGFVREGRQRMQLRGTTGWEDHIWYGLLREEWTVQT